MTLTITISPTISSFVIIAERDRLDFDVAIVGGGPAGLATAIRLKQLCQENDTNLEVAVIEKGAEIGTYFTFLPFLKYNQLCCKYLIILALFFIFIVYLLLYFPILFCIQ